MFKDLNTAATKNKKQLKKKKSIKSIYQLAELRRDKKQGKLKIMGENENIIAMNVSYDMERGASILGLTKESADFDHLSSARRIYEMHKQDRCLTMDERWIDGLSDEEDEMRIDDVEHMDSHSRTSLAMTERGPDLNSIKIPSSPRVERMAKSEHVDSRKNSYRERSDEPSIEFDNSHSRSGGLVDGYKSAVV